MRKIEEVAKSLLAYEWNRATKQVAFDEYRNQGADVEFVEVKTDRESSTTLKVKGPQEAITRVTTVKLLNNV